MTDPQRTALQRALELLGEHFPTALIIAQPDDRSPHIEVDHAGSCHAIPSLTERAALMFASEDVIEPPDDPEEKASL